MICIRNNGKSAKMLLMVLAVFLATSFMSGCGDDEPESRVMLQVMSPELLTVIPEEKAESVRPVSPQPFCESDLSVSDKLLPGMNPDYVRSVMGEPRLEQTAENPVYGTVETLTYDGLNLHFCDIAGHAGGVASSGGRELYDVVCKTGSITFARGLHVGSTLREVLASFADDRNERPLYFNSTEPNGTMLYGDFTGGKQHEDVRFFAYIDRSRLDEDDVTYYTVNYVFEKPLTIYADNAETDLCETYTIQFYIDAGDDRVAQIRLLHEVMTWALPAHLPS